MMRRARGTDTLEVSGFRCDEQGGGILHCDVLVGPCIREATNHLLAPLLGCDEQGGGTTLHCDVLVGPCIRKETDHLEVPPLSCDEQRGGTTLQCDVLVRPCIKGGGRPPRGVHSEMRRTRGWHHPALRCPCRPLRQRTNRIPRGVHSEMR